jgi:hypothetical protein
MTHLGGVFLWPGDSVSHSFEWPLQELDSKLLPSPTFSTARNASCGMSTRPMRFIRFLPSLRFSRRFLSRYVPVHRKPWGHFYEVTLPH